MRNLRKLTAVVLAVALVLTSMAAAFAATEESTTAATATVVNGDKAAVLKELKLYAGTDDTNPAAGLEKPLEVQQALAFLATEFGYKAEADKMADEDADKALAKFVDGKDVATYAKKVVAYSVQEGIIAGEKTNDGKLYIRPAAAVKATRFATFIIKALGYDLTGSFTESVAQLSEVEGAKIDAEATGDLTRDAAVGFMYGILTAKTDSGKTVAENLLAADSSLQTVLSKNSLLPVNGTLAVDSVKAVANNKVAVTLKEEAVATAADFAIVKKGTTTAVAVKDVVKESAKVFIVETDALTGGTSYTLTVNGASINFTGIAADNSAPTIVKVTAPDTNTFELEFSDKLDYATATDVANYTWDKSLKTVKAELNGDRNKVKLTTDVAKRNVYYNLTIANVKNSDGKAIAKTSRNIQAIEDKVAPRLNPIKVQNNRMLVLTFQDANGMNKAALETLANYSINDLTITSATAYDATGDDDKYETVVLVTDTQTQGKTYTLTIENLTDNSVLANPLGKVSRTFRGASEDKTAPTVKQGSSVVSENNTLVTIEFTDNNAMDAATLEDISNYTITHGNEVLDVISAKASDTKFPDGYKTKKVTLTTAAQEANRNYKLEIKSVADEFGNVLKQVGGKNPVFSFSGSAVDTRPPYVVKTAYVSSTQVKLTFDGNLDEATAEDPTNYSFNKDIGAPIKAELSDDKVVTLTTQTLTANTTYTITINNVEDKFENAMSNVKVDLLTNTNEIDTTIPSISYIWAANDKEIHIFFDEKITAHPTDLDIRGVDGNSFDSTPTITMTYAGELDDGKTLVYRVKSAGTELADIDYVISRTDASPRFADAAGNKIVVYTNTATYNPAIADRAVFTGNVQANEAPRVEYIEQINVKKIKVTFSEPVQLTGTGAYTAERGNTDISDTHQYEWYLKSASKFSVNQKLTLNFSAWARDFVGTPALEMEDGVADTIYYTYLEDDVKPVITGVAAIDNDTIEVTYDEDIDRAGSYKVYELYYDNSGAEKTRVVTLGAASSDGNVVTINTVTALALAKNYYLVPISGAYDVAGNREDVKDVRWDFAGSDVRNLDLVKGVGTINAKTVYLTSTRVIPAPINNAISVVEKGTTDVTIPVTYTLDGDKTKATISLPVPTISGKSYVATVTYANGDTEEFGFDGNTPDIGLDLVRQDATTVTLDLNGYTASDYTTEIYAAPTATPISGTAVTGTTDELTFGTAGTPANASEYYVVLNRTVDGSVEYAAKVIVTIPDSVATGFMTIAKAGYTHTALNAAVVSSTTTAAITLSTTPVPNTFSTVSWSAVYGSINADTNVYTIPARPSTGTTTDILTVTITIGGITDTKTFTVNIPATGAVTVTP